MMPLDGESLVASPEQGAAVTFLVDLSPVRVRQSLGLSLQLLLLLLGLFLHVGLVWAHGQGQSVGVLLQAAEVKTDRRRSTGQPQLQNLSSSFLSVGMI